jgi:hypothetical protein
LKYALVPYGNELQCAAILPLAYKIMEEHAHAISVSPFKNICATKCPSSTRPYVSLLGESIEKEQESRHGPREGSATKTPEICQNPKIHENPKTIGRKNTEKGPTLGRLRCGSREGFAAKTREIHQNPSKKLGKH